MVAFDGGSVTSAAGFLLLCRLDQQLSLFDLVRATDPLGQETRPAVHQDTPVFEYVRAGIGRLDAVSDRMRQGCLDHLAGMVRRPKKIVKVSTVRLKLE